VSTKPGQAHFESTAEAFRQTTQPLLNAGSRARVSPQFPPKFPELVLKAKERVLFGGHPCLYFQHPSLGLEIRHEDSKLLQSLLV